MKPKKNFLQRWLSAGLLEMIDCPYQPGNLRILKKGCLARLDASLKWNCQNIFRNELFHYTVKQGLLVCQSCPVKDILPQTPPVAKSPRLRLEGDSPLSFYESS